jgi:hypothetical protein
VSPNDLLGMHWRYRHKNSKLWQTEIHVTLHQQGGPPQAPFGRARVCIERRSPGELDPDNLVGAVKPIIDALRYSHVLVDDSPAHLELVVTQVRSHKLPARTLIEIQPIEVIA